LVEHPERGRAPGNFETDSPEGPALPVGRSLEDISDEHNNILDYFYQHTVLTNILYSFIDLSLIRITIQRTLAERDPGPFQGPSSYH
jgi:hypothetical protein